MNIPLINPKYFLGSFITNAKLLSSVVDNIISSFSKSTVTQITSATTGVTINTPSGIITTVSLTTLLNASSSPFTVTNNKVLENSVILLSTEYAAGKTGGPVAILEEKGIGFFKIKIANGGEANLNDIVKIHFLIN